MQTLGLLTASRQTGEAGKKAVQAKLKELGTCLKPKQASLMTTCKAIISDLQKAAGPKGGRDDDDDDDDMAGLDSDGNGRQGKHHKGNAAPVVIGVIAGIALVALLAVAAFWYKKRRQHGEVQNARMQFQSLDEDSTEGDNLTGHGAYASADAESGNLPVLKTDDMSPPEYTATARVVTELPPGAVVAT